MKTLLVVLSLLSSSVGFGSCPNGCSEWEGTCACDDKPYEAPSVNGDTEKPTKHPQAAWQRGEVVADMPQSLIFQDAKLDQEKAQADSEGKKAAGIIK